MPPARGSFLGYCHGRKIRFGHTVALVSTLSAIQFKLTEKGQLRSCPFDIASARPESEPEINPGCDHVFTWSGRGLIVLTGEVGLLAIPHMDVFSPE